MLRARESPLDLALNKEDPGLCIIQRNRIKLVLCGNWSEKSRVFSRNMFLFLFFLAVDIFWLVIFWTN